MGQDLSLAGKAIRQQGGFFKSVRALYIRDMLKYGKLVGTDKYGNRYYENNAFFVCRNRWVEYADHTGLNYDGSMVPAEWFGWLHHRTDLTPDKEPFRPKYPWIAPHEENMTGTREQYVPYSTTRPKIEAWTPPRVCIEEERPPPERESREESEEPQDPCCRPCEKEEKTCDVRKDPYCGVDESILAERSCEEEKKEEEKCGEKKDEKPTCEKPSNAFH